MFFISCYFVFFPNECPASLSYVYDIDLDLEAFIRENKEPENKIQKRGNF